MVVSGHRETNIFVDSDWFRRDSELGQLLMTFGKLSNQAPSVKSRLMLQFFLVTLGGNRVD